MMKKRILDITDSTKFRDAQVVDNEVKESVEERPEI